jgi:hypothetical protein
MYLTLGIKHSPVKRFVKFINLGSRMAPKLERFQRRCVQQKIVFRRINDDDDDQGCQIVYFQTKTPTLGKFWRALYWKMLMYFMAVWNIWLTFRIFYDNLEHFVFLGYIFPVWVSCTKKNLATLMTMPPTRVTRLGEFTPIGQLFTWGRFKKNTEASRL